MRIRTLLLLLALVLQQPALAQDAEYPTLAALANLEVPAFDYVDMVGRMSGKDTSYAPPTEPPHYEIGDSETFTLIMGEDIAYESVDMELRGLTDRVLIWVLEDANYPRWRAQQMAQRLETYVLDPVQGLVRYAEPPGVDGDSRLYVALSMDPESQYFGYFLETSARPKGLYPNSNQHEMLVVNLAADDDFDFFDDILIDVVAHEYMHILQSLIDQGEELWLNEAIATYVGYVASKPFLSSSALHSFGNGFLEAPDTGLTQWRAVEDMTNKYGAGGLFIAYLVERFGDGIVARLLADQANGWRSITKVLRKDHGAAADEIFADWVLANYFLDYRRGYGYKSIEADLTAPQPTASYNSFPATHESRLPQYSTEYITVDVRGADKLRLHLWQEADARLVNKATPEGDHFYYAVTSDDANSTLTRAIDLSEVESAWVEFRVWYNLEENYEYGYVTVSEDGGESWKALRGIYMRSSDLYDDYYPAGYSRSSANWMPERIGLSQFAPGQILLRFEVNSSYATKHGGMAIDDLRIDTIDFSDGFETHDESWIADGWIRTDNRLPNNTWLQVAQETRDGIEVSRSLISGSGDLIVDILPGVSQVVVALSPIVPQTSLTTEYELELNLINAAGEIMVVSRECTVTTTHALNFRASPNGNKIGLVPEGAALDAFDREGDWFKVEYAGRQGWIHGDYVHSAGKCP